MRSARKPVHVYILIFSVIALYKEISSVFVKKQEIKEKEKEEIKRKRYPFKILLPLRKQAYSSILKISPPKTKMFR